ncbi:TlpA family protein disulfide reductase [Microbispora catharanthi]|uniref:Redoxin domain-containing protein n=1 Tax=Microbispora catharanthi TaxID=1712871 RepID=A0A5N6BYD5_9ACTN|nr:redoxin domain-containing protein [Microbispora catharanthi]KAB8185502.1 redoxin domain-containing protein [Microbispora catharanthi]
MSIFAVSFAGLVGVLNLLLTAGVIRRLRAYDILPAARSDPGRWRVVHKPPRAMRAAGERVGAFHGHTVRGEPIGEEFFARSTTLVGAFTAGCQACEERLPEFAEFAAAFPGGGTQVLALLVGDARDLADKVRQLEPVATVVVEPDRGGPVGEALGVRAYPALALVDPGGVVSASGAGMEHLFLDPAEV